MVSSKISNSIGLRVSAFSFAALALTSLSLTSLFTSGPVQARDPGAKGLFFEQLQKPAESLNTGLRYWIEMKRDGNTQHVSNKTQFKSGDSIRFHVRSNINGYAYILLSSGSRGEQSVLFPDEKAGENNKIGAGREYILPQDGSLTFDENPGTEKLTLLLSRTPIDAKSYLAKPAGNKEVTLIASSSSGSKDLVPARIYVAYSAPHADGPPPAVIAAANNHHDRGPATTGAVPNTDTADKADKVQKVAKVPKKVEKKVAKSDSASTTKHTADIKTSTASAEPAGNKIAVPIRVNKIASSAVPTAKDDEGTTTVVSQKSSGVLHVDVDLEHI